MRRFRQQVGFSRPVEQGIAPGHHDGIERAGLDEPRCDIALVDADTDRLDMTGLSEIVERPVAALDGLVETPLVGIPVGEAVDIVDIDQIEIGNAETVCRLLERTHRSGIAVVEDRLEPQWRGPQTVIDLLAIGRRHIAAGLGRDGDGLAVDGSQEGAKAQLAETMAIERRGVEIAHSAVIGGSQNIGRLRLRHIPVERSDAACAEAEARDKADLARSRNRRHALASPKPGSR